MSLSPEALSFNPIQIVEAVPGQSYLLGELFKEEDYPDLDEQISAIVFFTQKDFEEIGSGQRMIWFAFASGQPVGSVQLLYKSRQKEFVDNPTTGELHFMQVTKSFRGKGIATRLNNALEERARRMGFEQLVLGVEPDNTHAIDVYTKWGYTSLGEREDKDHRVSTIMKKTL